MNKNTQLALAGFLTALASELSSGEAANTPTQAPAPTPEPPADPAPEPKRRGRPAAPAPTPATTEEEPAGDVKTLEELQGICKPLMAAGMGVQLKALVKKHGGQNLSTLPPENQGAFLADVDELSL